MPLSWQLTLHIKETDEKKRAYTKETKQKEKKEKENKKRENFISAFPTSEGYAITPTTARIKNDLGSVFPGYLR